MLYIYAFLVISSIIIIPFITQKLANNVVWGIGLFLTTFLFFSNRPMTSLFVTKSYFSIGSITFYAMDVLTIIYIIPIMLRLNKLISKIKANKTILLICLFVAYNFLLIFINISAHGFTKEIAAGRRIIPSGIILLYLLSFDYDEILLKRIYKLITALASILIIIALIKLFPSFTEGFINPCSSGPRALFAHTPLFLAIFFIPSLMMLIEGKLKFIYNKLLLIPSILIILLAASRAVWILTLTDLLLILLLYKKMIPKFLFYLTILSCLCTITIIALPKYYLTIHEYLGKYIVYDNYSFEQSTGKYRFDRWTAQFEQNFKFDETAIFGKGYGWDRTAKVRSRFLYSSMHNHYIEILFNGGLLSLSLFFLYTFSFIKNSIVLKSTKPINVDYFNIFIVLIVAFLPYGMVNGYPHYYYLILGIGAGFLDTESRKRKYASKVISHDTPLGDKPAST